MEVGSRVARTNTPRRLWSCKQQIKDRLKDIHWLHTFLFHTDNSIRSPFQHPPRCTGRVPCTIGIS
jgi:hypothetical protein